MKNFKIMLMAAVLLLGLSACSEKNETDTDTADDTVNESESESTGEPETIETEPETEKEVYQRPESVDVINYTQLEIDEEATDVCGFGTNPAYDSEKNCILFAVTDVIYYDAGDECSVGISSVDGAYTVDGSLVTEEYDDLFAAEGYKGAAVKIDEPLEAGEYKFVINFSTYTVSFTCEIK